MKYSLVGVDGNAYALMGYTMDAMKKCGFTGVDVDNMLKDAKSSNYNHLICVCADWIDRCNEKIGATDDEEEE